MLIELLTSSLLISPISNGIDEYQVVYEQKDILTTIDYSYDIYQFVGIDDNDNINIEFKISDTNDITNYISVSKSLQLNDLMPFLEEISPHLYNVPIVWFGIDGENEVILDYKLGFDFYFDTDTENLLEYSFYSFEKGGINIVNNGLLNYGLDYVRYSTDLENLFEYIGYNIAVEGISNDAVYQRISNYGFWDFEYSIPHEFPQLTIDFTINIGHIKSLIEMAYDENGLSNKINNLIQDGYVDGFTVGQEEILNDPNFYDLYTKNQYDQNYQNGYENGKLDAEVPVGLNWVKAAINVFFGFLGFMILPGVTLGDIFSGLIILLILKWVLGWFRG